MQARGPRVTSSGKTIYGLAQFSAEDIGQGCQSMTIIGVQLEAYGVFRAQISEKTEWGRRKVLT
jgi:hypothetical protein